MCEVELWPVSLLKKSASDEEMAKVPQGPKLWFQSCLDILSATVTLQWVMEPINVIPAISPDMRL